MPKEWAPFQAVMSQQKAATGQVALGCALLEQCSGQCLKQRAVPTWTEGRGLAKS